MPIDRGTTEPGFVNRNWQVVIRSTGRRGTDYLQYVYEMECQRIGAHYGADDSDIHDRKCPVCGGCKAGLPLS